MNYGYIYKTTNLLNGKMYIGQKTGSLVTSYHGSGILITRAIKKFSSKNFKTEAIIYLPTKKQLDEFERFLISKYREILGRNSLYNIADGGDGGEIIKGGGMKGKKHSEISIQKMKIYRNTPEFKERIAEISRNTWTGRKHKQESKKKIGKSNSKHFGKNHGNFGKAKSLTHCNNISKALKGTKRAWYSPGMVGKRHSKETKEKMRASHLSRRLSLIS